MLWGRGLAIGRSGLAASRPVGGGFASQNRSLAHINRHARPPLNNNNARGRSRRGRRGRRRRTATGRWWKPTPMSMSGARAQACVGVGVCIYVWGGGVLCACCCILFFPSSAGFDLALLTCAIMRLHNRRRSPRPAQRPSARSCPKTPKSMYNPIRRDPIRWGVRSAQAGSSS